MKILYLLPLLLVFNTAIAQIHSAPAAKITGPASRLVGIAKYGNVNVNDTNLYVYDTCIYTWSGNRGSSWVASDYNYLPVIDDYDQYTSWLTPIPPTTYGDSKKLRTWNSQGQVMQDVLFTWNTTSNTWDTASRSLYSYTGSNPTETISQGWNSATHTWSNSIRDSFSYSGNNLVLSVRQQWGNSTWQNVTRFSYTYSGSNRTSIKNEGWSSGSWHNSELYTYTYSGNNQTEELDQSWRTDSNIWRNNNRISYTYLGSNMLSKTEQTWNIYNGGWDNQIEYIYTYNGTNCTSMTSLQWNADSVKWYNYQRALYPHTGSNLDSIISQQWHGFDSTWNNMWSRAFLHDASGNVTTAYSCLWSGSGWVLAPGFNEAKINYYYELYSTNVATMQNNIGNASLFPNPVTGSQAYLNYYTGEVTPCNIQLLNMAGQVLYQTSEPGSIGDHMISIPVGTLPHGLYFVEMHNKAGQKQTLKLIR
ncbi:T9SS type A sorting domain-containing protein [Chitinophagaceae bacterium MMS25-I14]